MYCHDCLVRSWFDKELKEWSWGSCKLIRDYHEFKAKLLPFRWLHVHQVFSNQQYTAATTLCSQHLLHFPFLPYRSYLRSTLDEHILNKTIGRKSTFNKHIQGKTSKLDIATKHIDTFLGDKSADQYYSTLWHLLIWALERLFTWIGGRSYNTQVLDRIAWQCCPLFTRYNSRQTALHHIAYHRCILIGHTAAWYCYFQWWNRLVTSKCLLNFASLGHNDDAIHPSEVRTWR